MLSLSGKIRNYNYIQWTKFAFICEENLKHLLFDWLYPMNLIIERKQFHENANICWEFVHWDVTHDLHLIMCTFPIFLELRENKQKFHSFIHHQVAAALSDIEVYGNETTNDFVYATVTMKRESFSPNKKTVKRKLKRHLNERFSVIYSRILLLFQTPIISTRFSRDFSQVCFIFFIHHPHHVFV